METPSSEAERRYRSVSTLLFASVFLLASFGLGVLAIWPDLDLAAAAVFLTEPGRFAGRAPQAHMFRVFAAILPLAIYAGAAMLYLGGLTRIAPKSWHLSHGSMIFLSLSLALGPGLLVNGVFKDYFHRPRPVHIQAFGGEAPFEPFYRLDGDCPKNCSFPSGEAAAAFWLLAPAALVPPSLRIALAGVAILFSALTGLMRMAAGAHFLSDVLFSGWLMGLLIAVLWFVTRRRLSWLWCGKAGTGLHKDGASL